MSPRWRRLEAIHGGDRTDRRGGLVGRVGVAESGASAPRPVLSGDRGKLLDPAANVSAIRIEGKGLHPLLQEREDLTSYLLARAVDLAPSSLPDAEILLAMSYVSRDCGVAKIYFGRALEDRPNPEIRKLLTRIEQDGCEAVVGAGSADTARRLAGPPK